MIKPGVEAGVGGYVPAVRSDNLGFADIADTAARVLTELDIASSDTVTVDDVLRADTRARPWPATILGGHS